ncbi:hypothetical protein DL96DRAFT_1716039 [Flagelloscypha sp. PMI_526]|nr:hypothetical protein DL96DRAFT_1716039 [Flagelloscypha sp. PMI_526]
MDCERAAETMERRFRKVPGVYTRLSVEQGMQSLDVKFSNLHEVVSHAQSYLQGPHVTRNIDSLLRDLVLRPERIFVDMISGVVPSIAESLHPSLCPQPTPYFTGRQVELRNLEDHFTSDSKSCRVGVLYGIGGGGKTQIGLEFIQRCQHQFSEIFFVDASDKLTLETHLKVIARGSSDKPSVDDALRLLWTRRENWLLFFDNADDTSLDLRPYVSWPHGNVLITTRNREVRSHAPKCSIWVDRLGVEDATELLLRGVDIQRSSEVQELALKIVQELEYLALAINQARAFLTNKIVGRTKPFNPPTTTNTLCTPRGPLALTSSRMMRHSYSSFCPSCTTSRFQATSSKMRGTTVTGRRTVPFLNVIVTFLSTFTTVDSTWDILRFRELIREILSFSLLEFNVTNYSISLHPLVRQWAQHHTQRHAEVVCGAQTLLSLAIPTGTTSQDYATRVAFLPHLRESMKAGVKVHYTFLRRVGRAYRHGGMFLESSEFFQRGLSEAQQSGASHLRLLTFMSELARAYRDLGQTWEAKLLNEEEVELRKQAQGNEHPSTLTSMSNLALVYSSIGQYQDALQLNEQVVQLSTRVMGTEHPRTLTSMSNLACVYSELGQYQDALKLNEQVLRLRKQVLGEEHPSTLASMSNLAGVHSNLGQYQNALKLNEQVIELKKRVLGVEHPDTLATMSNLAEVYLALGRHQDAFKLNEEVLELMTRVLGREHPDTLVSMSNLAWIYSDLGQQEDALRLHERVLDLRRHSLGPEHPDTVNSSIWIAQLQVTRIEVGTEPQQRRILDKVKHFFTFSFK